MAGQEPEHEPFAAGPVILDDLAVQEALTEQARRLGHQHRNAAIVPFGDAYHAYWDEGSAGLLNALGVTSPTTDGNWAGRERMVDAYCDALETREAEEIEPGS